jgi:hypothetical protein
MYNTFFSPFLFVFLFFFLTISTLYAFLFSFSRGIEFMFAAVWYRNPPAPSPTSSPPALTSLDACNPVAPELRHSENDTARCASSAVILDLRICGYKKRLRLRLDGHFLAKTGRNFRICQKFRRCRKNVLGSSFFFPKSAGFIP